MAEYIDLVNDKGHITRTHVARDDAAQYANLYMPIVIVVLLKGEHVLVHARSQHKKVNPGDIDHVCGSITSGESPQQAALREAQEETGVTPTNLRLVGEGLNEYGRYRYLFVGEATEAPTVQDPREVAWTDYIHQAELYSKAQSGEFGFVGGFFDDLRACTNY